MRLNGAADSPVASALESQVESVALEVIKIIFKRCCFIDDEGRELEVEGKDDKSAGEVMYHLQRIMHFVRRGIAVELVLPAFPGKSPNRNKTLSNMPDYAEFHALDNLHGLCEEIRLKYSPGARINICSDGYVFSDIVRISDDDVKAYTSEIEDYCAIRYPTSFAMYDLRDVYRELGCLSSMREELLLQYGTSFMTLKRLVLEDKAYESMYKGITRFLCEDYSGLPVFSNASRTLVQKTARSSAYRVMQRSEAWSALLEVKFPDAIRLSIHPQIRGSRKIGVKLVPSSDLWRTPWHSVAVEEKGGVKLERRDKVDEINNNLLFKCGRPFGYVSV